MSETGTYPLATFHLPSVQELEREVRTQGAIEGIVIGENLRVLTLDKLNYWLSDLDEKNREAVIWLAGLEDGQKLSYAEVNRRVHGSRHFNNRRRGLLLQLLFFSLAKIDAREMWAQASSEDERLAVSVALLNVPWDLVKLLGRNGFVTLRQLTDKHEDELATAAYGFAVKRITMLREALAEYGLRMKSELTEEGPAALTDLVPLKSVIRDMRDVLNGDEADEVLDGLVRELAGVRGGGRQLRELMRWWRVGSRGRVGKAPGLAPLYQLFEQVWGWRYADKYSEASKFAAFEAIFGEPHGDVSA